MTCGNDHHYMAQAIQLAEQGRYTTDPNPVVGCVLVSEHRIIGTGSHQCAGEPHAEINALSDAYSKGHDPKGATAYVTLEPCSHYGKTPPCAEALVEAAVGRVVMGMQDPNPLVAGRGVKHLRRAGIEVAGPLLEEEARALNPGFIKRMQSGRPWVRCKMAMSLDGRTAMASGESKWITGPAARRDVQKMRARSSAIVTGIGTVAADNPSLTLRPSELGWVPSRHPARVILDRQMRICEEAKVLHGEGDVYLVVTAASLQQQKRKAARLRDKGVTLIELPMDPSNASDSSSMLPFLLDDLGRRGFNELMIEAGPTLSGAFVEQGLVDELVVYMAPVLMGSTARALLNMDILTMDKKIGLNIKETIAVGQDWRIVMALNHPLDSK